MFCIQEKESHTDPFSEKDPLSTAQSSSDDEPAPKRIKTFSPSLNLKVYQIPAFNKSLSIFPTPDVTLPKFVNNPLNLANPLALPSIQAQAANVVKSLHSRYSLPAKLSITPVQTPKSCDSGGIVRYKKNGEVAKKRGPPKGYKRKPKV
ncbi:hypothetical protein MSG28_007238 [Choristoneura fumiferana]|uniref:Uncharacterized protein n=2 Tax=Choristoneura fumiferana TaxID=7141 RepID=A0ACC0JWH1_CHOFU|nr:hypothetical protein MSG28_007238 [Choristoneura fumiferana]